LRVATRSLLARESPLSCPAPNRDFHVVPNLSDLSLAVMYCEHRASTSMEKSEIAKSESELTNAAAKQALISRLHKWCVEVFWITIFYIIDFCGDEQLRSTISELYESKQLHQQHRTSENCRSLAEIEIKLFRHLTSPLWANLRPITRSSKKRPASRPPSSQLFDIQEEKEEY
uniref:Cyclin N-terminal domain-containing protein n=1 Tax=Angiostrongylus cantonensis TaxID=6313 RepID=A0A0K0DKL3_ANGCA